MPVKIGSNEISYEPNYALVLPLGELPRLRSNCRADGEPDAVVTTEVQFTDISKLVAWRKRDRWQERIEIQPDGRATFWYVGLDTSEPGIINDLPQPESRPVGLVRRCWHRMW